MLMKGSLHTDELMRSVTAKVGGLRTDRRVSQDVFVMDVPAYAETLFVTGRGHQHLPRSRCQAGHHPERDRSLYASWLR